MTVLLWRKYCLHSTSFIGQNRPMKDVLCRQYFLVELFKALFSLVELFKALLACHSYYCCHCLDQNSLFQLCKHSASINECQWAQFFLHRVLWHTSPLMLDIIFQKKMMGYWQESSNFTLILPTSTFDIVRQHK